MAFEQKSMKRRNVKGLALKAPATLPPSIPTRDGHSLGGNGHDRQTEDPLEIGVEFRLDLNHEDLIVLKELGAGNGGTVAKVQHAATGAIMARKIIHVEATPDVRKRIVRELGIMHECSSPYIVSFFGAFMNNNGDVVMCMEYMDCGSLDSISKTFGPVRVDVLGKIAEAIFGGLTYLYSAHRIMHRDIKPSNVVLNSKGQIKLCDFGVSSELENSVADTFVGTGTYMAPERIQGEAYTVKSDVWSVGLTLFELAVGKFPFAPDADATGEDAEGPQGILDLLQQIVLEPAPQLPRSDAFPLSLHQIIAKCLMKNPQQRPTPQELFDNDEFIQCAKRTPVDLQGWAIGLLEKQQRRSHLPPQPLNTQLPPQPSAFPRSAAAAATLNPTLQHPSSADIPIGDLSLGPTPSTQPRPFPVRTASLQQTSSTRGGVAASGNLPQISRRPVGMTSRDARYQYPPGTPQGNGAAGGTGRPFTHG